MEILESNWYLKMRAQPRAKWVAQVRCGLLLAAVWSWGCTAAEAQDAPEQTLGPATSTPAWQWSNPVGNRIFGKGLVLPAESGARLGGLAPVFELPSSVGQLVRSDAGLGKSSLFVLLLGDGSKVPLTPAIAEAMGLAELNGKDVLAITSKAPAPAPQSPIRLLLDEKSSLSAFSEPPLFFAVDRAGWLREFVKLPTAAMDPENLHLSFLVTQTPDPTPAFEVGKTAPDFSLPDATGQWRRVSALRDRKNLIITFFPKCFTGRCRTQLTSLRDTFPAFLTSSTEIWAVSVDPAQGETGQIAFAASLGLPFPLIPDMGRNISLLYDAASTPQDLSRRQSVLIDRDGIVRWIDKTVDPATHGPALLQKMRELKLLP